jgi:hypothetical protein
MAEPEYKNLTDALEDSFADPEQPGIEVIHTQFNVDPSPMLSAPITALTFLIPKPGIPRDKVEAALSESSKLIATSPSSNGGAWATIEEEPNQFLLVEGWTSVEVRSQLKFPWLLLDKVLALLQRNGARIRAVSRAGKEFPPQSLPYRV